MTTNEERRRGDLESSLKAAGIDIRKAQSRVEAAIKAARIRWAAEAAEAKVEADWDRYQEICNTKKENDRE